MAIQKTVEKRYMSTKTARAYTGMGEHTFLAFVKKMHVPRIRVGQPYFYDKQDLDKALSQLKVSI